ncbi:MAG: hypothetical protein ABR540_21175 [Acidimicrobiales bacterium]
MPAPSLVDRVLDAYGAEPWARAGRFMAIFSLGGLALASHLRPQAVRCRTAFIATDGSPGVRFDGEPSEPAEPAEPGGGGLGRWDDREVLAFAGASLWSWVGLPFALGHPDVETRELPLGHAEGAAEGWARLEVRLPPSWPAGGARHLLDVDPQGRIRRHEERLSVLGGSRAVRHELSGHCEFGGALVATHRATALPRPRIPVLWGDIVAAHLLPRVPTKPLN